MSGFDFALAAMLVFGAFLGYREGFLMALFSLVALILGVLGAFKLMSWAMLFLTEYFDVEKNILPYVAFAVVFVAIVILVRMVGNLIRLSIDKTFLGRIDQVAGAGLGIIKTAFMLSVMLWIVDALKIELPAGWTTDSWLLPQIAAFAPQLTTWVSDFVPLFHDIF